MWFVPGGRILKDELMQDAFLRLTQNELGVAGSITDGEFLGVYEHFYEDNFSSNDFSTHYVAMGYRLCIDLELTQLPHEQHRRYQWWSIEALLVSDAVHRHTKWYFDPAY